MHLTTPCTRLWPRFRKSRLRIHTLHSRFALISVGCRLVNAGRRQMNTVNSNRETKCRSTRKAKTLHSRKPQLKEFSLKISPNPSFSKRGESPLGKGGQRGIFIRRYECQLMYVSSAFICVYVYGSNRRFGHFFLASSTRSIPARSLNTSIVS
jgi:hypothetical protein